MAEGIKYEAYTVQYSVTKDTGTSTNPIGQITVLMDTQKASAERAIQEVRKLLVQQGHLSKPEQLTNNPAFRDLKVHGVIKTADLGATIIVD
jgi:hypothetical protein